MAAIYKFSDLPETLNRLQKWANTVTALIEGRRQVTGETIPYASFESAFKSARRRVQKHYGFTSKYMPHQGAKEKARRVRQMKRAA